MAELNRLKRLVKSVLPDFSFKRRDISDYYHPEDARVMINELALSIPPKVLKALLNSSVALDEFLTGIYLAEDDINERIINERKEIDPIYNPQAHIENNRIAFTITHNSEEIIFAEYKLNYRQ
ncbi:MAG: hypothetical protein AB8F95_10995 [Bacteroidia bacterium]